MDEDDPVPRHHHLASPRAAAAFGTLAFAGIGATIMAPQAFFVGAVLCWIGSAGVIYMYHPEILSIVRICYNREWTKFRDVTDDAWLACTIAAFTILLPIVLFIIRVPIETDTSLVFGRPTAATPTVVIHNLGSLTAEGVKYTAFLIDLDATQISDNNPVANAECEYIKAHQGCGPLTMTFNTTLSFPKGHRILGIANVNCLNCIGQHSFWIFMHWQEDGWYSAVRNNQTVDLQKFTTAIPAIKSNTEAFLATITTRMPFATAE
jgi:hypothetical protein